MAAAKGGGRVKGAARKKGGLAKLRNRKKRDESEDEDEKSGSDEEDDIPDEMKTKKQLMKEAKKRDKADLRKFDESQREAKNDRQSAKQEAYKKKEEEREAKEREREELARQEEEERKKKEQEEFEKWKDMFSVEESGAQEEGKANEYQDLLGLFIEYMKVHKVTVLEDLAAEFLLSASETVERVNLLEKLQRITGVVDDRGKFIYITQEEMQKVAEFIKEKGRCNIKDITAESNKVINLASAADKWSKEREQVELLATADAGLELVEAGSDKKK